MAAALRERAAATRRSPEAWLAEQMPTLLDDPHAVELCLEALGHLAAEDERGGAGPLRRAEAVASLLTAAPGRAGQTHAVLPKLSRSMSQPPHRDDGELVEPLRPRLSASDAQRLHDEFGVPRRAVEEAIWRYRILSSGRADLPPTETIREQMGQVARLADHLRALLSTPDLADVWHATFDRPLVDAAGDGKVQRVPPLLIEEYVEALRRLSGAAEARAQRTDWRSAGRPRDGALHLFLTDCATLYAEHNPAEAVDDVSRRDARRALIQFVQVCSGLAGLTVSPSTISDYLPPDKSPPGGG